MNRRLCTPCARRDIPGVLPIPLPAWQRPEASVCINCGAVGDHRYTSVRMGVGDRGSSPAGQVVE